MPATPYREKLNPADMSFLRSETQNSQQRIGTITVFAGSLDPAILADRLRVLVDAMPKLRSTLNRDRDAWIEDADFSLQQHYWPITLQGETTLAVLTGECQRYFNQPLDYERPLWDIYSISGQSGPACLFFTCHHCVSDGLGLFDFIYRLLDTPESVRRYLPNPKKYIADSLLKKCRALGRELLLRRHPWILNGANSDRRTLQTFDFPLEDIRVIKRRWGLEFNEALLWIVCHGVRLFTIAANIATPPTINVLIPVNTRRDRDKHRLGNFLTGACVPLPAGEARLVDQKMGIVENLARRKTDGTFGLYIGLLKWVAKLPRSVHARLLRMQNIKSTCIVTTLQGPVKQEGIGGVKLIAKYAVAALFEEHPFSFAFVTCQDLLCVAILSDDGLVAQPEKLGRALEQSLTEILRLPQGEGSEY